MKRITCYGYLYSNKYRRNYYLINTASHSDCLLLKNFPAVYTPKLAVLAHARLVEKR